MSSRGDTDDPSRKPDAEARANDSNAEATKRNAVVFAQRSSFAPLHPRACTREKELAAAGCGPRGKRKTLSPLPLNQSEGADADAAARQTSSSTSHQSQGGLMNGSDAAMALHPQHSPHPHRHLAAVAEQEGGSPLSPPKRSKSDPAIASEHQQQDGAAFPPPPHHHHHGGHAVGSESGASQSRSHSPSGQQRAAKLAKSSSELNISNKSSADAQPPQLARQVNRFSQEELEYLDRKFQEHPTPNVQQREQMAADLSRRRMVSEYESIRGQGWPTELTQVQIKYWFDHQRRKIKKQRLSQQQQHQQHQQHFLDQGGMPPHVALMNGYSMQAAARAAAVAHAGVGIGVAGMGGPAGRTNTPPPPRMAFSPTPPPPPGLAPMGYNVHAATTAAYGTHPYMQQPAQPPHNPLKRESGLVAASEAMLPGAAAGGPPHVGARTSPTGVLPAVSSTQALNGFAPSGLPAVTQFPTTMAMGPVGGNPAPSLPQVSAPPPLPRPGTLPNPTGLGNPQAPSQVPGAQDMWPSNQSTALIQLWHALSLQNNGQMLQQFKVQQYQPNELILQRNVQLDKGIFVLRGNLRVLTYGSAEDSDEAPLYSAVVNEGSFIGKPNINQESGGMMIQAQTQCFLALVDQQ